MLEAITDHLYKPKSATVRADLVEFFRNAEMSCLANDILLNMQHKTPQSPVPFLHGTSLFKQLRYLRELEADFLTMAKKLQPDLVSRQRAQRLVASIEGTIAVVRDSAKKGIESAT